MAKVTKTQLNNAKREEVLNLLAEFFAEQGEDVMREAGNALVFPSTNSEGDEIFVKLVVSIPRGSRLDGEAYDGYAAAEDYKIHLEEKAERKKQVEKEKAEAAKKRAEKAEAHRLKKEAEERKKAEAAAKRSEAENEGTE